MGQFLWVEEVCPQIPILAYFVKFIESRDRHFCGEIEDCVGVSLGEFYADKNYRLALHEKKMLHKSVVAAPRVVDA